MKKIVIGIIIGVVALALVAGISYKVFDGGGSLGYSNTGIETVIDGATGTSTIATVFNATPYRNLVWSLATNASASQTIKFLCSSETTKPNFVSAQSYTNVWDYCQIVDLEDGTTYDGDTGIVLTGTDDYRLFEMDTNGVRWATALITSYTAGTSTVKVRGFDNL